MSRQLESHIVSCVRSAMIRFANVAARRKQVYHFPRPAPLRRDSGFRNACPVLGLQNLKGENGSNLIEYALVFMFLMSMLLGIVDFGRALYTYHFLSNAAREATRWAAVRGNTCTNDGSCTAAATEDDIETYVKNITPSGLNPNPPDLTTTACWLPPGSTTCGACNAPGCTVQVQVKYNFTFVVPFIRTTPLTLSSSSEMIIVH